MKFIVFVLSAVIFICIIICFVLNRIYLRTRATYKKRSSLKVNRVVVAINNNPNYLFFWPILHRLYEKMGLNVTLAHVSNEPNFNLPFQNDIIHFKTIQQKVKPLNMEDIMTNRGIKLNNATSVIQAQFIRFLIPALFPNDGVLVLDADNLIIRKDYLFQTNHNVKAFINYRGKADDPSIPQNQIAAFPILAKGSVWGEIAKLPRNCTLEDIHGRMNEYLKNNMDYHWFNDQVELRKMITEWKGKNIYLGDKKLKMKRVNNPSDVSASYTSWLQSGVSDIHLSLPKNYPKSKKIYKQELLTLVELL